MIELRYDAGFLKAAHGLPITIQRALAKSLEVLQEDPHDTRLHTKKLVGHLTGYFSFRVTRDWRVIYQFIDARTIRLNDVAHRKDAYR